MLLYFFLRLVTLLVEFRSPIDHYFYLSTINRDFGFSHSHRYAEGKSSCMIQDFLGKIFNWLSTVYWFKLSGDKLIFLSGKRIFLKDSYLQNRTRCLFHKHYIVMLLQTARRKIDRPYNVPARATESNLNLHD